MEKAQKETNVQDTIETQNIVLGICQSCLGRSNDVSLLFTTYCDLRLPCSDSMKEGRGLVQPQLDMPNFCSFPFLRSE